MSKVTFSAAAIAFNVAAFLLSSSSALANEAKLIRQCEDGDALICYSLASQYVLGSNNVKTNNKKAVKYYEKACALGHAESCYVLGGAYMHKLFGLRKDKAKAAGFLGKACDLDHADACYYLGNYYEVGFRPRDASKASEYFKKACDLGSNKAQEAGKCG